MRLLSLLARPVPRTPLPLQVLLRRRVPLVSHLVKPLNPRSRSLPPPSPLVRLRNPRVTHPPSHLVSPRISKKTNLLLPLSRLACQRPSQMRSLLLRLALEHLPALRQHLVRRPKMRRQRSLQMQRRRPRHLACLAHQHLLQVLAPLLLPLHSRLEGCLLHRALLDRPIRPSPLVLLPLLRQPHQPLQLPHLHSVSLLPLRHPLPPSPSELPIQASRLVLLLPQAAPLHRPRVLRLEALRLRACSSLEHRSQLP